MQPADRAYWATAEPETQWTARATAPIARPQRPDQGGVVDDQVEDDRDEQGGYRHDDATFSPTAEQQRLLTGPSGERQTPEAIVEGLWAAVQRTAGREANPRRAATQRDPAAPPHGQSRQAATGTSLTTDSADDSATAETAMARPETAHAEMAHAEIARAEMALARHKTARSRQELQEDPLVAGVRKLIEGGHLETPARTADYAGTTSVDESLGDGAFSEEYVPPVRSGSQSMDLDPGQASSEQVGSVPAGSVPAGSVSASDAPVGSVPASSVPAGSVPARPESAEVATTSTAKATSVSRPTGASEGTPGGEERDERLTVQGSRPSAAATDDSAVVAVTTSAQSERRVPAVPTTTSPASAPAMPATYRADAAEDAYLMDPDLIADVRDRWAEVQSSFVDDPEAAVEEAGRLAADAINGVIENLRLLRHQTLEQSGNPSGTENLRLALLRIREMLDRLLSI